MSRYRSLDAAGSHAQAVPLEADARRLIRLAGWGVFLWFVVALAIRFSPPWLFGRGVWTLLLFAGAIPSGWGTVWLTRKLFGLNRSELVAASALASAAAMLCDGIAFTWSGLYGPETRDVVPAAAFILWGVAWILVAAFRQARPQANRD